MISVALRLNDFIENNLFYIDCFTVYVKYRIESFLLIKTREI